MGHVQRGLSNEGALAAQSLITESGFWNMKPYLFEEEELEAVLMVERYQPDITLTHGLGSKTQSLRGVGLHIILEVPMRGSYLT